MPILVDIALAVVLEKKIKYEMYTTITAFTKAHLGKTKQKTKQSKIFMRNYTQGQTKIEMPLSNNI